MDVILYSIDPTVSTVKSDVLSACAEANAGSLGYALGLYGQVGALCLRRRETSVAV